MLAPQDILYFRLDDISTRSDAAYCKSKGYVRRYDTKVWLSGLDLDLDAITNVAIAFDIDILTEANLQNIYEGLCSHHNVFVFFRTIALM